MKHLKTKLMQFWPNCRLFRWIDNAISKRFRRRLKNDNFTILSSNCIGGIIYHRLGKQFLSPTINMWFKQPEFASFCLHLDYYLKQELRFYKSDLSYPTAELRGEGDIPTIHLYFNHAKTEDEARGDWEKRKTRINHQNLFIILYKLDGITIEQLKALEAIPCRGRVVLSAYPIPEISWAVVIQPNMRAPSPYSFFDRNIIGLRRYERHFDFVTWLNGSADEKQPAPEAH